MSQRYAAGWNSNNDEVATAVGVFEELMGDARKSAADISGAEYIARGGR